MYKMDLPLLLHGKEPQAWLHHLMECAHLPCRTLRRRHATQPSQGTRQLACLPRLRTISVPPPRARPSHQQTPYAPCRRQAQQRVPTRCWPPYHSRPRLGRVLHRLLRAIITHSRKAKALLAAPAASGPAGLAPQMAGSLVALRALQGRRPLWAILDLGIRRALQGGWRSACRTLR